MNERVTNSRRVAVLMGGPSEEREISLLSGRAVVRGLREAGYDVLSVDVRDREPAIPAGVEGVFIALHGTYGEDGGIQAYLDARGIPYTGSGAEASRTAFDKILAKRRFEAAGIPTAAWEALSRGERPRIGPPAVVKPARQGSSIGLRRVLEPAAWEEALEEAFRHDETVLVEAYIEGRELTVGIVGEEVLTVVEIVAPDAWYDYRAKYTHGACRYVTPAELPEADTRRLRDLARRTFDALGCAGFGRVDFRGRDGDYRVLEVNTIPGFTENSLLPKAAAAAGIGFPELCARIMESAFRNKPSEPIRQMETEQD